MFVIDPASSALLVAARSSVGPVEFATTAVSGTADVAVTPDGLDVGQPPIATLLVPVDSLTSGNALYDAEVRRRLDARRFPTIRAELRAARALDEHRWALTGDLTIHGTTCALSGTADVRLVEGDRLLVHGEQVVDMRDFGIALPTALMLRIFPDCTIRFRFEAVRES